MIRCSSARQCLLLGIMLVVSVGLASSTMAQTDLKEWRKSRPQVKIPVVRPDRGTLSDLGPEAVERAQILSDRNHEIHQLLGGRHVSRLSQQWLAERGLGAAASLEPTLDKAELVTDILRVLIIRIGFENDRSGDLTSVTTTGDFQLEPDPSVRIDPPPHNRDFFMAHLFGLSEYYRIQSGGRLQIQGRVLPEGQNDCYKLSDIADYGPGEDGGWTVPMLETLVRDMLVAADEGTLADGDVSMADFDDDNPLTYVILVHAGADWQTDINRDSPNDIPTFFVTLGEPQALVSIDSETGEPGQISECSIIPETTTQDDFVGSIAGALYHEFGHALGLPDVYDTSTGLPAVGLWDLMDSGPNLIAAIGFPHPTIPDSFETELVAGVLPPSLSAWSRWFLGWLKLGQLTGNDQDIHLPAVQVPVSDYFSWYRGSSINGDPFDFSPAYPQAIIAGASPREFVLIENRWVPEFAADLPDETGIGFVRDDETNVLLYMGGDYDPLFGAFRNTGMYDYFMPAGGLLAWHVNQDRILERLPYNTINAGGEGLRLIEADGIQDVGVFESFVLGFYGSHRDPFPSGTSDHLLPEGAPSARAWDASWTGAELHDISAATATMTFQGRILPLAPQSPWRLPPVDGTGTPRTLDPETLTPWNLNQQPVLIAGSKNVSTSEDDDGSPWLFGWKTDGSSVANTPADGPDFSVLELGSELAGPPLVVDEPLGTEELLILALKDGTLLAMPSTITGSQWVPQWSLDVADNLKTAPALLRHVVDDRLLCPIDGTTLVTVGLNGVQVGEAIDLVVVAGENPGTIRGPLVVANAEGSQAMVTTSDAWFIIGGAVTSWGWFPESLQGDAPLSVVTLTSAADDHIVISGEGGETLVITLTAAGEAKPVTHDLGLDGQTVLASAVADLDADGSNDLILVTETSIHAFNRNLAPLTGWSVTLLDQFPLDGDTGFAGGIIVFDGDGDGINEVWATTDGGHLIAFDARGNRLPRTPFLWADRGISRAIVGDAGELGRILWLADPGGRERAGLGQTAVHGAIVGFLTPAAAGKSSNTSEWLGPAGGPRRNGPVGEPIAIAGSPGEDEQDRFIIYPNPARGDHAVFRFWAEAEGQARVTVFNIEGEIVGRVTDTVSAGAVAELNWALGNLAPGVYLCRFEVPGVAGTVTRTERLAVER